MPEQLKRATLSDVATKAGVSIGTVSRVLNSKPSGLPISEATKDTVLEAAQKLNYAPNFLAKSLKLKRTNTIGMLTFSAQGFYESVLIQNVNKAALENTYNVIFCDYEYDQDLEFFYLNLFVSQKVDALIVVGLPSVTGPSWLERLQSSSTKVPIVFINEYNDVLPFGFVTCNSRLGGEIAAHYLLSKKHKRIAVFDDAKKSLDIMLRQDSFKTACARGGCPVTDDLIVTTDLTTSLAYQAAKQLFQRKDRPDALFALGDEPAFGAIRAAHDCGLAVPDDIAIIGYDDVPFASWSVPRLTTVRQPLDLMARVAVEMVIKLIEKRRVENMHIYYPPELVVRESA